MTLSAAKNIADRGGVVRVGLLGCGHVGSALVRLIEAQADSIAARAGVKIEVAKVAVRNLAKERDVDLERRSLHPRRRRGRERPVHRSRRRGHRRDRTGPHADPHRAGRRQAGGHGQQGAAGQLRPRAVRDGRGQRRRPPLRGVGVRRHPAAPAAAGIAGRRPDPPDHRDRQRHHQLRADPHDGVGDVVPRGAGRGADARLRRARPDGRCRGLRRRRQGGHPRLHRLRRQGGGRRRVQRRHLGRFAVRHRVGPGTRLRGQAAGPRSRRSTTRSPSGSIRPWCRSTIRWPA